MDLEEREGGETVFDASTLVAYHWALSNDRMMSPQCRGQFMSAKVR